MPVRVCACVRVQVHARALPSLTFASQLSCAAVYFYFRLPTV